MASMTYSFVEAYRMLKKHVLDDSFTLGRSVYT